MHSSLGTKIKALRTEKKLSQKELCGDFINRVVLSRIENDKMQPSFSQLQYIADKLEIPISSFLSAINHSEKVSSSAILEDSYLSNLFDREAYGEIIKLNELSEEKFHSINDYNKYYYLGMSYFNSQIYRDSIKPLRKYINRYNKSNKELQKQHVIDFAIALNTLSKLMLRNKSFRKAEQYLLVAKKYLYEYKQNSSLIYSIVHNNLVYIYTENNEYEKAIYIGENFLNSRGNILYMNAIPNIHTSLNIAYYNVGKYEESIRHIKKAINLFLYEENHKKAAACYLNYINALRYCNRFDEAFDMLKDCKKDYILFESIYLRLLIQELILYFNMKEYNKVIELSKDIPINKLKKNSKCDFYFILGHINYMKNIMKTAYNYLLKCEDYFINESFDCDLKLLYDDLYQITNDEKFKEKSAFYNSISGRKNIVIKY